jgi:hypothetical protein
MEMMHPRELPDAREARGVLGASQEGSSVRLYVGRPRKMHYPQRICGMWEEGADATNVERHTMRQSREISTHNYLLLTVGKGGNKTK